MTNSYLGKMIEDAKENAGYGLRKYLGKYALHLSSNIKDLITEENFNGNLEDENTRNFARKILDLLIDMEKEFKE